MQKACQNTVRNAGINDLSDLVDLHLKCFSSKEHLAVLLGRRFIEAAYRWFINSQDTYTILTEENGVITGLTTVAGMPYNTPMLKNCKTEALQGVITHPWIIFNSEIVNRFFRLVSLLHILGIEEEELDQTY